MRTRISSICSVTSERLVSPDKRFVCFSLFSCLRNLEISSLYSIPNDNDTCIHWVYIDLQRGNCLAAFKVIQCSYLRYVGTCEKNAVARSVL